MSEPTRLHPRRYTRRQKAEAVVDATMTSVKAAAEKRDIPRTTVQYWFDAPEFVALRQKTREDLAPEAIAMAHLVLGEIRSKLGQFEPRDLTILWGVLTDKAQLLAGKATTRTETITSGMDDHEREALRAVLDDVMKDPVDA